MQKGGEGGEGRELKRKRAFKKPFLGFMKNYIINNNYFYLLLLF